MSGLRTSQRDIERILLLARSLGVALCSFGDMIRVPGFRHRWEERSRGADVRIVHSPLDRSHSPPVNRSARWCFAAVGFETTAPGVASVVLQARELCLANFSVYASHKLIVPAMKAVLEGASCIEGFITPGHVSVIIGPEAYEDVAQHYAAPCVATGFEPSDVLEGIAMVLECIAAKRTGSFVQYTRAVKPGGNTPRGTSCSACLISPMRSGAGLASFPAAVWS